MDRGMGLRGPDPHDPRDYMGAHYWRRLGLATALPDESTNRRWRAPTKDQLTLGACVAFTFGSGREFLTLKVGHTLLRDGVDQRVSPLFGYHESQRTFWPEEYARREDTGDYARNAMRILAGRGYCREVTWPYVPGKLWDAPPGLAYAEAKSYGVAGAGKIRGYRVDNLITALHVLAAGWPVAVGIPVYQSFYEAAGDGEVPRFKGLILGYHEILLYDYRKDSAYEGGYRLTAQNSWGEGVGGFTVDGDLHFHARDLEEKAMDMWAVALLIEPQQPDLPPGPSPRSSALVWWDRDHSGELAGTQ